MISSIKSHLPNLTLSGVSKVETISPPKTINHEYIQKKEFFAFYQVLVLNVQHLRNLHVQ